jgi:23S rRNA pseudouridine1911/1915/1917 synthase
MPAFLVSQTDSGRRLDRFLCARFPDRSRSFLQRLIAQGRTLLNGRVCKPGHRVRAGDEITVTIPPPRPLDVRPQAIALEILHEDDDLLVVNKPAGMVVHPAAGHADDTLVNALLHHCRATLSGIGGVERPGIVHRLDKGTSGCIVVAKNDSAHRWLVNQFKQRSVNKIYRAICRGHFQQPSGTIQTPIGRSLHDRKKMAARRFAAGRPALTQYRVLRQLPGRALVELTLHTGRTHQIRVHMAHLGHPVLGDPVYGRARAENISIARPMLHAYKLGFTHPRTREFVEFTAPTPPDMQQALQH